MSAESAPTRVDELGPIDYLVIEFEAPQPTGEGLGLLVDLVERGIVRVLDLLFLKKDAGGRVTVLSPDDVSTPTFDVSVFAGASSGLIADEDLAQVGDVVTPGATAVVLVYENAWAAPLAATLRRGGGQLVANGRIPVQALLAALDESETETESAGLAAKR